MDKTIICPGCGWIGAVEALNQEGGCPDCSYENGLEPYRLLTLAEMLNDAGEYADIRMDLFLKSLFKFLGYPDNQEEWPGCQVVHWSEIDGG